MRLYLCAICASVLITTGIPSQTAPISLAVTSEFTVPGLTDPIEKLKFNDIDSDGEPEILASDGERLILYSPSNWSTLLNVQLPDVHTDYAIVFDDVNRDLVPDVLLAYYFACRTTSPDTACVIYLYDGASDFLLTDSTHHEAGSMITTDRGSPFNSVTLTALDITGDGHNELFCSFDKYRSFEFFGTVVLSTEGLSWLSPAFAQPATWNKTDLLIDLDEIGSFESEPYFATTKYDVVARESGDVTITAGVEIVDAGGNSHLVIDRAGSCICAGDSMHTTNSSSYRTSGNINLDFAGTEMLIRHFTRQTCFIEDQAVWDTVETSLALYNLVAPDSVDILWNVFDAPSCSEYFYSPDYPGKFFGIDGGYLYVFNGENGQLARNRVDVTSGKLFWTRYSSPDVHKLVGVRNQTVTIHELDLVTDTPLRRDLLPQPFTLGPAYPNPFNPDLAVPVNINHEGHLDLAVYNLLGQKVKHLHSGRIRPGERTFWWNGTDKRGQPVTSGVYLIRSDFEGAVQTAKAVLLK